MSADLNTEHSSATMPASSTPGSSGSGQCRLASYPHCPYGPSICRSCSARRAAVPCRARRPRPITPLSHSHPLVCVRDRLGLEWALAGALALTPLQAAGARWPFVRKPGRLEGITVPAGAAQRG